MNVDFLLPVAALIVVATAAGVIPTRMRPRLLLWLTTLMAGLAAATVGILVIGTTATFALGPARSAEIIEWCRVVPLHHRTSLPVGIATTWASAVVALRVGRVIRARSALVRSAPSSRVAVIDSDEPVAYAVPAGEGCVVVSTGLLTALPPRERQVVFAHERAHIHQRHHRFLLAGELSRAVVPMLGPLISKIRHASERCADEAAVTAMAGDRHVVAAAISRSALRRSEYHGLVPGFGGGSIRSRVEALVGTPQTARSARVSALVGLAAAFVVIGAAAIQLHHVYDFVDHVCHG